MLRTRGVVTALLAATLAGCSALPATELSGVEVHTIATIGPNGVAAERYVSPNGGHLEWWVPLDWRDISDWDAEVSAGSYLEGAWATYAEGTEEPGGVVTVFRYDSSNGWTTPEEAANSLLGRIVGGSTVEVFNETGFSAADGGSEVGFALYIHDDSPAGTGNTYYELVIESGQFYYEFLFQDMGEPDDEIFDDFRAAVSTAMLTGG